MPTPAKKKTARLRAPVLLHLSPSTPLPDTPLVEVFRTGSFQVLRLRLQMIGSVNGKHGVNYRTKTYFVNRDYAARERGLIADVQALTTLVGWETAPEDCYQIHYLFHFDLPKNARDRTGDNHNPLKPMCDILVHGGALYDDQNTRQEVVSSTREAGDDHWATVTIYRFPDPNTFLMIPFGALARDYLDQHFGVHSVLSQELPTHA